MKHTYIIIDDDQESILKTHAVAARFQQLAFVGSANNYDDGLDLILEHNPKIVFLEIDPKNKASKLSLQLVNELYRYLKVIPKIIITTKGKDLAFEAIKYDVLDYFIKPMEIGDCRKTVLKFEKANENMHQSFSESSGCAAPTPANSFPEIIGREEEVNIHAENKSIFESAVNTGESVAVNYSSEADEDEVSIIPASGKYTNEDTPLIICVKSYGDYRYIDAKDIRYLQADNNSTDIHMNNGEMITAFKTLKHFEGVLAVPFIRIHNSYIVNIDHISRIHTGNAVCYITNTTTKLPFSKSYKENVDAIINYISNGNYLEI